FPPAAATALMVARLNFWAGQFYGQSWGGLASTGADLAAQLADLGKKAESAEVYRMAVAVYSQAIGLNPGLADECHNRAWHLTFDPAPKRRDGRLAAAFAQLAVKAAPTNGVYWNTLGAAHYRKENWKEAVAALEKSMELRN